MLLIFFVSLVHADSIEKMPIEYTYGKDKMQAIDLYPGSSDKVLIWIHGGGWLVGDKRADRWVRRFHRHFIDHQKYNVFMIGYRVGRNTAPQAVEDVICAYQKIETIIDNENFSSNDIIVAGASAGGHLALMLGLNEVKNTDACKYNKKPKAVVNLFGITDLQKTSDYLDDNKFFTQSNYVKSWISSNDSLSDMSYSYSPVNLNTTIIPNILTIHGTDDSWVPYNQAEILHEKLKGNHILVTIEKGGHYRFKKDQNEYIGSKIDKFLKDNYKL
ncbi:MAG: alpha/beta hydrolase fold domain-containing protein [Gammaproteobacteria bacterium]